MRLTGFSVSGFGLLSGIEVDGIGAGTTVVCGPNEAGKSTLHAFLVRTLFGHPRINDRRGRPRHEPLRGGRHGGMVRAVDAAGGAWEIHRYTSGSPVLRVVAPDGTESTSSDAVTRLIGRAIDEDRFEQVFAIDLDALSGLGRLGDGALDELLLDAATVGAGRSMRQAIEALEERRDGLWTPRSRTAPLDRAHGELRDAQLSLRDARDCASAYAAAAAACERLSLELGRLRAQQAGTAADVRRAERLLAAWEPWQDRTDAEKRVAAAGSVTVPEDLVAEATDLRRERDGALARAEQLRDEAASDEHRAGELTVDATLGSLAEAVGAHAGGLELQRDRRRRLAVANQEARTAADVAEAQVRALGPGWDTACVEAVPADPSAVARVEQQGAELASARSDADAADRAATRAAQEAADAQMAADEAGAAVGPEPAADLPARQAAIATLRSGLPYLDRAERDAATGQRAPRWPAVVAFAAALLLVGVGAGALVADATALGIGTILGALLVAGAALGTWRAARSDGGVAPTSRGRSSRLAADLRHDVETAAATLGIRPPVALSDVERAAADLVNCDEARRAWRERRDAATAATRDRDAAAVRARTLTAEHAARQAALDVAHTRWVETCGSLGLDGVEPAGAAALLRAVADAQRALGDAARLAREREELAGEVASFDAVTTDLLVRAGRDAGAHLDLDVELTRLTEDCQNDAERRSERAALLASAERGRELAEVEDHQVAELRAQLAILWDQVGASDEDTFDEFVAADAARRAAEAELDAAERTLRAVLGGDGDAAELRRELAGGAVSTWEARMDEGRARAVELDQRRDEVVRELADAEGRLAAIGTDDAVATAGLAVETHIARCAELADEWAVTDVAVRLLRTSLERFEAAHQPQVLRRTGELLATATLGSWSEVRRIDDEIYVADGGDPVPATSLSRGATEQLYLCLRLALAEELNDQAQQVPLLVDDLMANADPERAAGLARILADVATRQQVIVFTCNPATADVVVTADPTARVLTMAPRGGGAAWRRESTRPTAAA